MIKFLKKLPLYLFFLKMRIKFFTDEKLLTQLSKRGHSLDKAISQNIDKRLYFWELKWLLEEYCQRKLESNDISAWVWNLLYQTQFRLTRPKNEPNSSQTSDFNLAKIIKNRRSIRAWQRKKVKIKEIIEAIDLAKWAPSSCNRQPWKFLIVTKRKNKEFLQIFNHQLFYQKAPFILVALVNIHEYGRNEKHYSYLDIAAVIQNLLLILDSKGLGACWLGIKQTRNYLKKCKKIQAKFKIEKYYLPVSIIAVGYPKIAPLPPGRKKTKDLIILE